MNSGSSPGLYSQSTLPPGNSTGSQVRSISHFRSNRKYPLHTSFATRTICSHSWGQCSRQYAATAAGSSRNIRSFQPANSSFFVIMSVLLYQ